MSYNKGTELDVQSQSVEQIYENYIKGKYIINRRYQRKLVWTIEEKRKLIDSIQNSLPIPLVLVAESSVVDKYTDKCYEIIDGLQRIDAIVSFIENQYSYDGKYFDLDSMGVTIDKKKSGEIVQKEPILDREICRALTQYRIPISTYRSADSSAIDEVFRRINSSGRKLSMQEVRQAGVVIPFAELVRKISAEIRGDVTPYDKITLAEASKISISDSKIDSRGIYSGDIFWVNNGVLKESEVRTESRDEEYVADLLMDILFYPDNKATSSNNRDSAYKQSDSGSDETISRSIRSALAKIGEDEITSRFMRVFDTIRIACDDSGKTFVSLVFPNKSRYAGVPRYYEVIFVAIYAIMYNHKILKEVNYDKLISILDDIYEKCSIKVETRGGDFTVGKKSNAIKNLRTHLEDAFYAVDGNSPEEKRIRTEFENKLKIALTEDSMFELKQGFTALKSEKPEINNEIVAKIVRTATAMSNMKKENNGYIYFGVADKSSAVDQIETLYEISHKKVYEFNIVGINHELERLKMTKDDMYNWIVNKISKTHVEPSGFKDALKDKISFFRYEDYLICGIEVPNFDEPVYFDDKLFHREGNSTCEASHRQTADIVKKFP